ncbi:MAG: hypothetical protein UW12_C0040G0002 [Parcubacteria group bacterium GW2011_GWF1_43_9]|nr:MAG: hypothetical protein UW12_C0040G0002 [Parcubacteria group bacterium GW2011_GWF1_43_9]
MHKFNRKLLGKLNIATALFLAVLMTGGLLGANYVLAANTATQQASTAAATTISVVGKVADTAVGTITFPEGAPSATVSTPYNDVDTVSDAQVLSGTVSEPVVRLKNGSGGTLNVTLEITTWNGTYSGFVASEDYELVVTTDTTIVAVASALSADGNAASVATGIGITTGAYKALYLELVLGSLAGKSDTSTLTILGETP